MKTTLSTSDIAHALKEDKHANWSWAGARALAEYLEEYEEETGEELELDVVAIRCDFSEYSSLTAWAVDYFSDEAQRNDTIGADEDTDEDELEDMIRDHINDNGTLIEFDGGVIVSIF